MPKLDFKEQSFIMALCVGLLGMWGMKMQLRLQLKD